MTGVGSSEVCSKASLIQRRKTEGLSKGSARMKEKRVPRSASLFWTGVPVRHQRELAWRAAQER